MTTETYTGEALIIQKYTNIMSDINSVLKSDEPDGLSKIAFLNMVRRLLDSFSKEEV